jgi:hypothetical protein
MEREIGCPERLAGIAFAIHNCGALLYQDALHKVFYIKNGLNISEPQERKITVWLIYLALVWFATLGITLVWRGFWRVPVRHCMTLWHGPRP